MVRIKYGVKSVSLQTKLDNQNLNVTSLNPLIQTVIKEVSTADQCLDKDVGCARSESPQQSFLSSPQLK